MVKLILSILALINGGFMLADGIHVITRGKYIGPEKPGPWSELFMYFDVDVFQLGPLFILFGLFWLILFLGYLYSRRWVYALGIGLSILTLWYLPFGTLVSILTLILLLTNRNRIQALVHK